MSRSSPGVNRVAAILNFIATHPGQDFALTDLVRALKLSRATCHALLTGLVEVGYLYRTSDKTYVLGPALAEIGRTASQHFSPLQVAHPEMRILADEFDVVCGAYFLEGDLIHLRDRAASHSHVAYPIPLGIRIKLRAQQAVVYFSRSLKDAEAWMDTTTPALSPEARELMVQSMEFTCEHGFSVLVRMPGVEVSYEKAHDAVLNNDELLIETLAKVDHSRVYPVAALMAPVFDAKERVSFALVMAGLPSYASGAQIMTIGARLQAACARISNFVAGRSIAKNL